MEDLKTYIDNHKKNEEKSISFTDYLDKLLKKYGYTKDSTFYNKANILKQTWQKIITGKVNPSIKTIVKIAFVLHATNHECKYLMKKAGYTLSSSSNYSLIIRYCLNNKIYDLDIVNNYLEQYGYIDDLIY